MLRTVAYKILFFFIYVFAIAVSFGFIGGSFVFVTRLKIESVALLVAIVTVGFIGPLAAAYYSIENWKRVISGEIESKPITFARLIIGFGDLIIIFIAMLITAGGAALIAMAATERAPILMALPPTVLGIPAIVLGVISYIVMKVSFGVIVGKIAGMRE